MSKIDRIVAQLRRFPPLAGEDEFQLRRIAGHVTAHPTTDGEVLLREGEVSRSVHLLIEGRVAVTHNGAVIAEAGPGSILGEMGMIDHSVSSATVSVTEPGLVLTVDWLGFDSLLDSRAASRAITAGLAERVRRREQGDAAPQ
jgi:CRP/FNR family transcriptional regulator, cyclic AMP receptor protein